ncbi:ABC transporter substrate-binding protein [Actinopolymorpha pittospori]|uniref:Peptide/nickel transport system substrate-binding protein n=1 Tax=Actinopolymorpha pittospori TaxID=648752 RepID=A0A927MMB4_9ACTN|nr:peptide/nickel transport system substrate-binding protein [Actinopolymorpha pittospori]
MDHAVSRKKFLTTAGMAIAAVSLSGCDVFSTEPTGKGGDSRATGAPKGKEAPALAAQVKQGKLPPVEQRLPKSPLVVNPVERIGRYGGTWRTALVADADRPWMERTLTYEGLLRYNTEWNKITPNVAERYEVNDDASEYTFHLREGMRWSDGEPFTADDVLFWYEDVFMNTEVTSVKERMMCGGQEPMELEKVDDLTFVVRFPTTPNALFERLVASGNGNAIAIVATPRHYLREFHAKYNPNVDKLAGDAGFDDWVGLFSARSDWAINTAMPTLNAWIVTSPYTGNQRVVAKRNPYYWKVDPDGSQLPYIDEIVYTYLQNVQTCLLKALNGEFDMHSRHINTLENKPVIGQNREKGDYRFFDLNADPMNAAMLTLNLTHKDPVKREIFQNKNFRIGLSYALNRAEIIKVVYRGQGEPWQGSPRRETEFYDERLAKQYVEYDVAKANEYLDRAGYPRRDGDGLRLGPNGKPIFIQLDTTVEEGPEWIDVAQFIVRNWRAVGIDARADTVARTLVETRRDANTQDIAITLAFGGVNVIMDPREYLPVAGNEKGTWVAWYASYGKEGEEPPADVRRQMELYEELKATRQAERQRDLMKEILQITTDRFPAIGINLPAKGYGIARNNFRNVPKQMYSSQGWTYPEPAPSNPCQYFFDDA